MLLTGRGGEGVVLASQLLADTLARAGRWVQSFPEFKAERRGAPISAFLRWDDVSPIRRRHKVRECDVLVALSPSPPTAEAVGRVREGGLVLLNRDTRFRVAGPFRVARVPASRIARDRCIVSPEGRPMANAAMLGACVRLLQPSALALLEQAITDRMGAIAEPNVLAARDGYEACTLQRARTTDTPAPPPPVPGARPAPLFAISTVDSLGNHTGSWSLERPVIGEACTACGVCAVFCPEGAIGRDGRAVKVDYLYCKGCGICVAVCPVRDGVALEAVPA